MILMLCIIFFILIITLFKQSEKEDKLKARELRFGTIDKTVLTAIKKRTNGDVGKQKNFRGGKRNFPYKKRY